MTTKHHPHKGPIVETSKYVIIVHDVAYPGLTAQYLTETRDALQEVCDGPLNDHHGVKATFRIGTGPTDRATDEYAIHLRKNLPEAPGALAYHAVVNGRPDIEVDLTDCVMRLDTPDGLPAVLLHEVAEAEGDPGADEWVDIGQGKQRAKELCDRVQNLSFKTSKGVLVSNFLLKSAFIPGAPGPWDYVSLVTGVACMQHALDYSNGYDIEREPNGTEQQLSALEMPQMGSMARRRKHRHSSRFNRRMAGNS